jgi:HAD superfamily hydrolase (TIGR01509 family)
MPLPEAILWDMDGVLADTNKLHIQTWEKALHEQGLPFDRTKFSQIFGLQNTDLVPILVGKSLNDRQMKAIADKKEAYFRKILPGQLKLLPGVLDWLIRFNNWGCKQAVASSAPAENVLALVDELGIHKYFDALVTPGSLPGKPNPAVFLLAANQLGVSPHRCIVIEDSIPGIEAARRAGMYCIAVTTSHPAEVLTKADIIVESLERLAVEQVVNLDQTG